MIEIEPYIILCVILSLSSLVVIDVYNMSCFYNFEEFLIALVCVVFSLVVFGLYIYAYGIHFSIGGV